MNNKTQIYKIDANNVFLEILNDFFHSGKVVVGFHEYDGLKDKGKRKKQMIYIYISFDDFLLLSNDVLNGRIYKLGKKAKENQKKGGYNYSKEIWDVKGTTSALTLKEQGREREDGQSEFRQMKLTPGENFHWIFSGEYGPGEANKGGLILPSYVEGKPDGIIRVPLTNEDLKKMVLVVKTHIEGYIYSKYL